jgi:hypothetical protein
MHFTAVITECHLSLFLAHHKIGFSVTESLLKIEYYTLSFSKNDKKIACRKPFGAFAGLKVG